MKTRQDSFFGIHCDFHAIPDYGTQGVTLKEEDIRKICHLLKPDFLQIDCKGHPGWASYPTKLGNAMPDFATDTLAMWRRVTREEGVPLYMHYSGIYDMKYCAEHPEECVVNADGTRVAEVPRPNGRYVDELLIPQLLELAGDYGVDGVWMDGDCWKVHLDYHPDTLAAFEREYGISLDGKPPRAQGDPYYPQFCEYCRELFRRYVRHYTDTVHAKYPHFQICSNWAYSDHMPEAISANVDFISGDLAPGNSFNSARYAGRAIAQQTKAPWDLMSWNFRFKAMGGVAAMPKHPVQLMQEAASVVALGGAYQNYVQQFEDGSPNMMDLCRLVPLAEFLRAREPYCFRGRPIHQVAMLLSTYDRHMIEDKRKRLYSRAKNEGLVGMTALLCDASLSTEIVSEHTLTGHCGDYPVIVVPELLHGLESTTVKELLDYVEAGGNLVLSGENTCRLFAEAGAPFTVTTLNKTNDRNVLMNLDTGHKQANTGAEQAYYFTLDNGAFGALISPVAISADDGKVLAKAGIKQREVTHPLASLIPFGKGNIVAIGFDIGKQYTVARQYLHRALIKEVAAQIYEPIARVEAATGLLEIICLEKDNKLMLQLINANGAHADAATMTEDTIPPVLDVKLSIALPHKPKKLVLRPEGRELPFAYENGRAYVTIDRLDLYEIIEVVI